MKQQRADLQMQRMLLTISKGTPFGDAHEITGRIVLHCIDIGKTIDQLTVDEFKSFSALIDEDIYNEITLEKCISARNLPGGPSKDSVLASIV